MRRYRFEIKQAEDKQWYFTCVAPNGETVLTSEMYVTASNARRGAKQLRRWLWLAKID